MYVAFTLSREQLTIALFPLLAVQRFLSFHVSLIQINGPKLVDQDVLLRFVRWMDYFIFCSTILSSFLQVYVLKQANRNIRREASDHCLHVFLFSMTMGDFIQTALCYPIEAIARILDIRDELPMILNVTVHFLTWVSLSGSSLSLILLNFDKLLYFKYPLSEMADTATARHFTVCVKAPCVNVAATRLTSHAAVGSHQRYSCGHVVLSLSPELGILSASSESLVSPLEMYAKRTAVQFICYPNVGECIYCSLYVQP
ncbi:hypothetical protein OSTOST_02753 [Ostertagia ostertagi]